MQQKRLMTTKQLATSAICIALASVLSMLKIYHFPFGGSVTAFSMLFICLPGFFYGLPTGLLSGFAYGLIQFAIEPYFLSPLQFFVDYVLAFSALGLSGLFCRGTKGLVPAYLCAIAGRYIFAVISGYVFFAEYAWEGWAALPYSLCYNGAYIFTEGLLTVSFLCIPGVQKVLLKLKRENHS